ncbi:hypothetical protein Tco_0884409 [Tanacetum coccineum]
MEYQSTRNLHLSSMCQGLTSPEQTATDVAKGQWIAEISGLLKSLEGKLLQRYKEKNRSVADQEQLEDFYITTSQEA